MKIAFIGQKGIPSNAGGVERHVDALAHVYVSKGHTVFAYVRPQYISKDLKEYDGIRLIHIPTIKGKHLDAGLYSFFASIHVLFTDVDVINYQAIGPAFFSILPKIIKPSVKIVVTNHGIDWQRAKWGKFAQFFLKLGEKVSVWTADEIICVSPATVEYYANTYGISAKFIPNGVDLQKPQKVEKIEKFGLDSDKYILFMARLVPEKGAHYLIDAFKQVDTDMKLVIAGDGPTSAGYVDQLKKQAADDSRIMFTGQVCGEDWLKLFSNAYLFVQPSELDAAAFSILEAMSFEKAVLVSDIADNVRLINGNGFTFENKNTQDLAKKLQWLITNPDEVKKMGERALSYVSKKFKWSDIAERYISSYITLPEHSAAQYAKRLGKRVALLVTSNK